MSSENKKLSSGEFETLKILWALGVGTVAQVRDAHNSSVVLKPAYTTTMTVLGRLVDKEAALVDKDKQPFQYRPAHPREMVLERRLREFLEVSYGDDSELLLRHLLDGGHVDTDDLRKLLKEEE